MKKLSITTSTIHDGDMRENEENVRLEKFLNSMDTTRKDLITMSQVHSADIIHVSKSDKGKKVGKCDALVTGDKNVALGVFTADCLPIVLADEDKGVLAIVHAGYRGIAKRIVKKTLREMKALGAKEENISVYIGPGIEECCYDVDEKRVEMFGEIYPLNGEVRAAEGKIYLSLKKIVKNDLSRSGIPEEKIHISPTCTKCSDSYFSFRKNNKITGLNITVAQILS